MKELKGSPRQIAWACDIRNEKIAQAEQALSYTKSQKQVDETQQQQFAEALDNLKNYTSAEWWIEHRAVSGLTLLKITYKEYISNKD